jgi:hypothetical protein
LSPKVNHGQCRTCSGPIVYLGAQFCGPKCWAKWVGREKGAEDLDITARVEEEREETAALPEPPPAAPLAFLEPPPDESPKRRIYL